MKRTKVLAALLLIVSTVVLVGPIATAQAPDTWIVGFSQIGAESEWRNANTFSVQNAIGEDPTLLLIFSDAQQKQENQIKALRSFIARGVDVIAFTALVETGYGPVLEEARDAGIPVIMIDRDVAPEDRHLR
ncbi:MAG TPA: substrate-binding domain-containing protein, partial [Firmicutes bacterium]|nr:substrate-binding domain-containing protein [Bacillota bacterium]